MCELLDPAQKEKVLTSKVKIQIEILYICRTWGETSKETRRITGNVLLKAKTKKQTKAKANIAYQSQIILAVYIQTPYGR